MMVNSRNGCRRSGREKDERSVGPSGRSAGKRPARGPVMTAVRSLCTISLAYAGLLTGVVIRRTGPNRQVPCRKEGSLGLFLYLAFFLISGWPYFEGWERLAALRSAAVIWLRYHSASAGSTCTAPNSPMASWPPSPLPGLVNASAVL